MKPRTFFEKLSQKINELDPEQKKDIFCKNNLSVLKRISEYCSQDKKVMVITDREETAKFWKIINRFDISFYVTRKGWAIFFTNFDRKRFTRPKDDRYRFLKKLYPNCREYKELLKKRNKFFKDVLK